LAKGAGHDPKGTAGWRKGVRKNPRLARRERWNRKADAEQMTICMRRARKREAEESALHRCDPFVPVQRGQVLA
jgi:hypothetical protein